MNHVITLSSQWLTRFGVSFTLLVIVLATTLAVYFGEPKYWADVAWVDVLGEGSLAVVLLAWIITLLVGRPPGHVTSLLLVGLNALWFTCLLDLCDEFFSYSNTAHWLSLIESIPAAIGMIIVSVGFVEWHREQQAVNRQLWRRELNFRSHHQIDGVTQLYRADYWRARAQEVQEQGKDASIIVIDINDFARVNSQFGRQEGDRFLREISNVILMHLRAIDLASRYAGDRFVILLPALDPDSAEQMMADILASIRHIAFKAGDQTTSVFHSARGQVNRLRSSEPLDPLLAQMNRQLDGESVRRA